VLEPGVAFAERVDDMRSGGRLEASESASSPTRRAPDRSPTFEVIVMSFRLDSSPSMTNTRDGRSASGPTGARSCAPPRLLSQVVRSARPGRCPSFPLLAEVDALRLERQMYERADHPPQDVCRVAHADRVACRLLA